MFCDQRHVGLLDSGDRNRNRHFLVGLGIHTAHCGFCLLVWLGREVEDDARPQVFLFLGLKVVLGQLHLLVYAQSLAFDRAAHF